MMRHALAMTQPDHDPAPIHGIRRGFMFVLSSPSGAGKTTLSRLLLEQESGLDRAPAPSRWNEVPERGAF